MEIDPYKILGLSKGYTMNDLRSKYKSVALSVHPDKVPGNSDYMFKIVTKCYKTLLHELNNRQSDKQFDVLKAGFGKETQLQYKNTNIESDESSFNIKKFNTAFETNKTPTVMDIGYTNWMEKTHVKDAPELKKNINNARFNEQFEKHVDIDRKNNRQIMRYKEPEAMALSSKLGFIEFGVDNIDDFSADNRSNRDLNYMDYRVAHSTSRLVDPSMMDKNRKEFKTIREIEESRSKISNFSQREMFDIEKKKISEKEKERKRVENQKNLDDINYSNFEKMNKLMLGHKKY